MPYPSTLDDFPDPTSGGPGVGSPMLAVPHAALHRDVNAAIEGLQAKVGVTGSGVTSSHDYRIGQLEAAVPTHVYAETPGGAVNGANETFTLAAAPSPAASLMLFRNGVLQQAGGNDYTLIGSTVTFATAPETGDVLLAYYTT